MSDYDALVRLSAQKCKDAPQSIEVVLTTCGLNARRTTAACVVAAFPEFRPVVEFIDKTRSRYAEDEPSAIGEMLVEEYLAMQSFATSHGVLWDSVDFLALMAGMSGFMERFEKPQDNGARIVASRLQACAEPLCGDAQYDMVAMGLWFADFDGFRHAVARAIGALRQ